MLTFPVTGSNFFSMLPISEIKFSPMPRAAMNITGGGEVMTADLAPMLWEGTVTLGKMIGTERDLPDLVLDVLGRAGRTFWAYDTRRPYPLLDPTGAILGASTPTIYSLPSTREIRIDGLPAGYVLSRGDYLAFTYSGRRALHRVVDAVVTAGTGGITPTFEVAPEIRPGATVGTSVDLTRASCKAILIPGKTDKGITKSTITEGMTFAFIQTLKG